MNGWIVRSTTPMQRCRAPLAGLVLSALWFGGCGATSGAQLTSGTLDAGSWSARTYARFNEGTCLEIDAHGRPPATICGLDADSDLVWRPDPPEGEAPFVAGTTRHADAATVRAVLGDGTDASGPVVAAPGIRPIRFYVIALPPGATVSKVDVLAADGSVIASEDAE